MSEFEQRKKEFMEAFKKELSQYSFGSPEYQKIVLITLDPVTQRFFTLSELEQMIGITETIHDLPDDYVPDNEMNLPYCDDEEPNYEYSHKEADRTMAWLMEHGVCPK